MGEKELDFGRIPDAVQLFDALVKQHPDDPQARLALGRAHEAGLFILSLVTRANRADRPVLSSAGFDYNREHGPRGVVPSAPAEEAYRRDAIESYREALRFDPELLEARLRLGRLLWLGGKADAALRELAAVAAGSVPESSYLAHLFLSRIEDERGREPAAIAHAEAAVALGPRWQAGQLALADLLQRSGRGGDAAVIIASAVAVPDERASEDAWLLYHLGAYDRAAAAFEALRAMVPP
jgi:tetratricopeptide (TPR) repeat protein